MYTEAIVANKDGREVYAAMRDGERSEIAIQKLIAYVEDLNDMIVGFARDLDVETHGNRDPDELWSGINEEIEAVNKCREEYEAIGELVERYNEGKYANNRIQFDPAEPSAAVAELVERLEGCGG